MFDLRCGSPRRRIPKGTLALLPLCAALLAVAPASAWTERPVRFLVPAPPGGTMDVLARVLAEALNEQLPQPVIVDNRAGAGGAIAVAALLAAPADGQTLMVTASNVLAEIPLVLKAWRSSVSPSGALPLKAVTDFEG